MIQHIRYMAAGLLLLITTACDNGEVFYSAQYPIVRVGAAITLATTTPEGEEEPAIVATIRDEVIASAPVTAGGGYMLDFIKHNGGTIDVRTTADGPMVQGAFVKIPGVNEIRFIYGQMDYTCTLQTYTDTDGVSKAVLTEDFTAYYKALYPSANLSQVQRQSYTSSRNTK